MNLKQLQHFVAVAEELHFLRAARRLSMAQPPLSQSIARLEESLGFRLLERTRRSVHLTPAGAALLKDIRPALDQIDRGVKTARRIDAGELQSLAVGVITSSVGAPLPALLKELRKIAPEVPVNLRMMSSAAQKDALLAGDLDFGILFPGASSDPAILTWPIAEVRRMVAVREGSPLAGRKVLTIADLKDQPLIMYAAERHPKGHTFLIEEFERHGIKPRIEMESPDHNTTLGLVAAGVGVAIVAESGSVYRHVKLVPLTGFGERLRLPLSLAWRIDPPAGLAKLLEALKRRFGLPRTAEPTADDRDPNAEAAE